MEKKSQEKSDSIVPYNQSSEWQLVPLERYLSFEQFCNSDLPFKPELIHKIATQDMKKEILWEEKIILDVLVQKLLKQAPDLVISTKFEVPLLPYMTSILCFPTLSELPLELMQLFEQIEEKLKPNEKPISTKDKEILSILNSELQEYFTKFNFEASLNDMTKLIEEKLWLIFHYYYQWWYSQQLDPLKEVLIDPQSPKYISQFRTMKLLARIQKTIFTAYFLMVTKPLLTKIDLPISPSLDVEFWIMARNIFNVWSIKRLLLHRQIYSIIEYWQFWHQKDGEELKKLFQNYHTTKLTNLLSFNPIFQELFKYYGEVIKVQNQSKILLLNYMLCRFARTLETAKNKYEDTFKNTSLRTDSE